MQKKGNGKVGGQVCALFFLCVEYCIHISQSFPFLQRFMLDLFMNIHAHMHVFLFGIGLCPPKTDIFQRIWE